MVAAALMAGGCGGSDSSEGSAGEITVETGSLSKAEFIRRADAVCEAGRKQFDREYSAYQRKKPLSSQSSQSSSTAWIGEVVKTILLPDYEQRIDEISVLGAPDSYEEEVSSFLNSLQKRLEEMREKPTEATNSLTPFAKPVKLAKDYGLAGCAESLG